MPVSTDSPASLRDFLKARSAPQHEAAEAAMARAGCFRGADGFARYLSAMEACHLRFAHAETLAARAAGLEPRSRELLEAIALDRARLGRPAEPACPREPAAVSLDEAWGAQYSMEGSSMGARVLAPRSARFFPDAEPSRYLAALAGDGTGRWRAFVAALNASGAESSAALRGALRAFETVAANLDASDARG